MRNSAIGLLNLPLLVEHDAPIGTASRRSPAHTERSAPILAARSLELLRFASASPTGNAHHGNPA